MKMQNSLWIIAAEGAVTLMGTVAIEPHDILAEDTVAGLPGPKSVDNQLEIIQARQRYLLCKKRD